MFHSRSFRRALGALLLLLGVGSLIGGILWEGRGYISNILAGFTGACFGIPLAVFVVQKVLDEATKERSQSALGRLLFDEIQASRALYLSYLYADQSALVAVRDSLFRATTILVKHLGRPVQFDQYPDAQHTASSIDSEVLAMVSAMDPLVWRATRTLLGT
jgi:hypothetical protein